MISGAFPVICGCSSMAEQKLPKLPAAAVFRHFPSKPLPKARPLNQRLSGACVNFAGPTSPLEMDERG